MRVFTSPLKYKNGYFYFKQKLHDEGLKDFKKKTLCEHFGIDTKGLHDAIQDATKLAQLIITTDENNDISIVDWDYKKKPRQNPDAWKKVSATPQGEGIFSSCIFALTGTLKSQNRQSQT